MVVVFWLFLMCVAIWRAAKNSSQQPPHLGNLNGMRRGDMEDQCAVHIAQLNALQHAARTRTLRSRSVPTTEAPTSVWVRHPAFASSSLAATTFVTYAPLELTSGSTPMVSDLIPDSWAIDASDAERSGFVVARDQLLEPSLAFLVQCQLTSSASARGSRWRAKMRSTPADNAYMPHPCATSSDDLDKLEAVERLLGKAIIDGHVLPMRLCVPLFKALLGTPAMILDVRYVDETTYTSLWYIASSEVVDALALAFSVTATDRTTVIDLVPNGRHIKVNASNKKIGRLVRGFYAELFREIVSVLDHKELELLLCGTFDIDLDDWRTHTIVSRSLQCTTTLFDMSAADRAKLLHFTTGSSRVPLQRFKGLTSQDGKLCLFTLQATPYSRRCLPKVHTCFNRIDLLLYPTRGLVKSALLMMLGVESMAFTLE
ncbi:hypothetical protein SPRG_10038 [Saprolegnia parasitica CBS 223.65]|uniref:HECT-type E3 ubiquitin transferase n=1 Tax=Saprolegnia parasitica (strain CBS 223.65) TaxID=695850 RepID=A0A067C039_SAPPC|nr:hypothetical protein SPRG_10038 [Saprolegnia parasitica CBS 223.65]KDO23893.1 hypothetical protein SPRG_10038 [Saprolegnia parasitica CBS 223.65]|eukprot:XP_012205363.1 hypothetical protein SPRG_10038 [Saprolegnia parasitica CBS 223.65]